MQSRLWSVNFWFISRPWDLPIDFLLQPVIFRYSVVLCHCRPVFFIPFLDKKTCSFHRLVSCLTLSQLSYIHHTDLHLLVLRALLILRPISCCLIWDKSVEQTLRLIDLSLWLTGTVRAEPETVISRAWVQSPSRLNKLFLDDYWRACFESNFSDRQDGLTVSAIICDPSVSEATALWRIINTYIYLFYLFMFFKWLSGLVVSALGIPARWPRFDSRVVALFHWVATLGKLFTHTASLISQLHETGVQKGVFGA